MPNNETDGNALWRAIQQAGGVDGYITQQLKADGLLVSRQSTEGMSRRALEQYKRDLKAEAVQRRRLRRQAWLAYRQQHIVHLGDGIVWSDHWDEDRWDLAEADARRAENELPPLNAAGDLAAALNLSIPELRWFAYHRDAARMTHYFRFEIPKRSGGTREVWAPHARLKTAQRWILQNIVEKLPVHGAAHGFLPGRSILTNAAVHTDSAIILKLDIRDFFPSVSLPRVKGVFRKAGYHEPVALLLALLCTEAPRKVIEFENAPMFVSLGPRCLPQGAPTSPALTNTLCLRLDRRLDGLARSCGWRYSRYADDLTFSMPAELASQAKAEKKTSAKRRKKTTARKQKAERKQVADEMRPERLTSLVVRTVADEGFAIHPGKTRIVRAARQQRVTGLVVNESRSPRVPRRVRREVRAAIHNLSQGKSLRAGESVASLRGWIAYIGMTDPELAARLLEKITSATETPPSE